MKNKRCDWNLLDVNKIEQLKVEITNEEDMSSLANFFKIIGDETRVKILILLSNHSICVNEIAEILEMSKSAISHQLRLLKVAQYVSSKKIGKHVYYSIDDEHIITILEQARDHLKH